MGPSGQTAAEAADWRLVGKAADPISLNSLY